jgi:hypothetical protein
MPAGLRAARFPCRLQDSPAARHDAGPAEGRAARGAPGTFRHHEHGAVCAQAARSAAPCAPSTVMRTGFACTFHRYEYGGHLTKILNLPPSSSF